MSSAPTFRRSLAIVWRSLRSMRTALVLLLLLALASVAGSLVPQVGAADARIAQTFIEHPVRARIYDAIGLFDVYGTWWFTLIYVLLFVSLVSCIVPRTRATLRTLRARPAPARDLDALRHHVEIRVPLAAEEALAGARRVLRRRRFRVRDAGEGDGGGPALAGEKGAAREIGSLVFHWAFLLLLVGVVWGRGTGFSGKAVIVEGETWVEAHANYDGRIREGRFFGEDHAGARITVESFTATYRLTGQPKDFVTRAVISEADGSDARTVDIRVNEPASVGHVRFYQYGYGWAPVIRVTADGETVADGPVACSQGTPPAGVSPLQIPWECVLELPSLDPQVAIRFKLWPDSRNLFGLLEAGLAMPMIREYNPVMTYEAFAGDLLADRVRSVGDLDTTALEPVAEGVLGAGQTVDLPEGVTLSFPDLRRYTVLEVARDRGTGLVFVAAILVLGGLLASLYGSRRRVWVAVGAPATADDAGVRTSAVGSIVAVGGFAVQRMPEFEREFARLVADLEAVTSR